MQDYHDVDRMSVAALSASCIAAAVSLMLVAGTYDWFSVVISVTLLAIIFGYLKQPPQSLKAGLAVSAGISLSLLPLMGFVFEIIVAPDGYRVAILSGSWAPTDGCHEGLNPGYRCIEGVAQSRVWSSVQLVAWLVLLLAFNSFFGWRREGSIGISRSAESSASDEVSR